MTEIWKTVCTYWCWIGIVSYTSWFCPLHEVRIAVQALWLKEKKNGNIKHTSASNFSPRRSYGIIFQSRDNVNFFPAFNILTLNNNHHKFITWNLQKISNIYLLQQISSHVKCRSFSEDFVERNLQDKEKIMKGVWALCWHIPAPPRTANASMEVSCKTWSPGNESMADMIRSCIRTTKHWWRTISAGKKRALFDCICWMWNVKVKRLYQ